jgi:hypothetical protein
VAFCCPNCPKAFEKDTAKFEAKANLQLLQTEQIKQVKCPISGRDAAADKVVEVEGTKVAVCCGNCLKKANGTEGEELITLLFKNSKAFEPVKK